ncbi:MAG: anion permease [Clostridia bacterium]|nr:anion permease [Clostridia bacterium]
MISQILAVAIFVIMFLVIISEKIERHIVTLVSALLTLVLVFGFAMKDFGAIVETLNFGVFIQPHFWYSSGESASVASGINWETIVFILGMMIMVEGMARVGFFRWLCMKIANLVHYKTIPIFITFMLMSAVLAMFIDSITVILFLAAVTVELAGLLKFNPIPMILAEIFCANLGGSATMCGDPPNIIIGTSLGYSFGDFISNTGVVAGIALVFTILYFYLCFRKELSKNENKNTEIKHPDPKDAITDKKGFVLSSLIFALAVVLLVTHSVTGLTVSTIGVLIAVLTLVAAPKHISEMMSKVDFKTLLFFVGLFVVVGGLEQTKCLEAIAAFIEKVSGGNAYMIIFIIIWVSAIASAFVDNIPFAATMIPVISAISASSGMDLKTLAWALSMGTDIGGSATPIGASANVVGISVASREGYIIGWGKYCKASAPATIIVLIISTIYIFVRYL